MGGLGNQLFQLAAALSLAEDNPVYIDWKIAKPRLNLKGLPEIASFRLPPRIHFLENREASLFQRKTFRYLLRTGLSNKKYQEHKSLTFLHGLIGSLIFSFRYKRLIKITVGKGLGYSNLKAGHLSQLLIGYFQSYIWTEKIKVLQELKSLKSIELSNQLHELEKESKLENPLIVHLRFGDYTNEPSFGLLTRKYYINSIKLASESYKFGSLWIFSDEVDRARKILDFSTDLNIRFIEHLGDSTSINFDAMRLGHGYITANSSFSWWAARLSNIESKLVITPKPWFKELEDDTSLMPPLWKRLAGHE
jgi:hypothetical protein